MKPDSQKGKDWIGNGNSVYKPLGATNHTADARENNDYYATSPIAAELLLGLEPFSRRIWEPACGEGHLSKVLEAHGYEVISTDLVYRGYGSGGVDFLSFEGTFDGDIITNPPYKYAKEFVEKALEVTEDGHKVAMFLKILFLEGKERKALFQSTPLRTVYVSSSRILCAKNGNFSAMEKIGGAVAYGWFVWEKGYAGEAYLRWFN